MNEIIHELINALLETIVECFEGHPLQDEMLFELVKLALQQGESQEIIGDLLRIDAIVAEVVVISIEYRRTC